MFPLYKQPLIGIIVLTRGLNRGFRRAVKEEHPNVIRLYYPG